MDDSKGQIILFAQDYHPVTAYAQNRITASLHPASGTLYIFDRDGMLWEHGGVISTTGSGLLGFLNVNPGNTTLKVGRDAAVGGGCTGVETWAGFTGSQDIEVRANTVTSIVVQCFVPDGGRREAARSEPEPRRMVRPGR